MSIENQDNRSDPNTDDRDPLQRKPTLIGAENSDMMEISDLNADPIETSDNAEQTFKSASASSKSSSFYPPSCTSTVEYDQTPFADFSKQVTELCHALWPPSVKEYRIQRLLGGPNNRFLGVLRTKKLGRFLWPTSPPKAFEIERMSGGSFNRIVGIKIIGSKNEDPIPLVLRTSRAPWDSRPDREIATLQWLHQHASIPVPHIKAFDLTEENSLKTPYVIQNRIPGVSLVAASANMSHKQWCSITKQIAHVLLELQRLGNPTPGLIESTAKDDGVQQFDISPFDIKNPREIGWRERQANSKDHEADKATALEWYAKDTLYFLATQFGRWHREELRPCPVDILYNDQMRLLARVANEMNSQGIFGDSKNCLVHMDLAARNIMVEVGPEDFIKVTGVLDWDSAIFAPKFVSCRPPWWLWQDEKFTEDAMEDETNVVEGPADDPELVEIKALFDNAMGEEYVRLAYQPEYRLARRLFTVALHGNWSGEMMKEISDLIDDWEALKDAQAKARAERYTLENDTESADSGKGEDNIMS